jgi:glycosyltransferase involved in cell wall biosynthesis
MHATDGPWELICVDNNSTDETRHIIEEVAQSSAIPVKYVFERTPGLACARNSGLRNARGDILALTDDDCLVDPNWLVAIANEFREDASLAILGGRVELRNRDDLPVGIRTSKERAVIGLTNVFTSIGAGNMAFRRSVMATIGMFDPDFGAGSSLYAAEDADFVFRGLKVGLRAMYSPDILVLHDHGRQTEKERAKMEKAYVTARGAFYMKHMIRGDPQAMRLAVWEVRSLVKQILRTLIAHKRQGDDARILGYLLKGARLYVRVRVRGWSLMKAT